jgi:hypothetical protein
MSESIKTKNNSSIYYMVHCDDAHPDDTDCIFELNEFDKLMELVEEYKHCKWDYKVYIESFGNDNVLNISNITHLAQLNI